MNPSQSAAAQAELNFPGSLAISRANGESTHQRHRFGPARARAAREKAVKNIPESAI
ncbi:hypothetical protein J8I87_14020 [Paraburkholderia sp. LEh10]|uniref:hypothetical protein n=1 Tax=Paraburkholderia sp. LEh10 TaxID=2821353 RepID=UPI001AE9737F|nr:hypothetical protein [Paraburkholderia sp. LEh10]MBP0590809.1 hypothetical protein [Paraburkholderia sp. LEh10]